MLGRRSPIPVALATLALLATTVGAVQAQDGPAPDLSVRCEVWGGRFLPSDATDTGATLGLGECSLPTKTAAEVGSLYPTIKPLLDVLPIIELHYLTDPGGDSFNLEDGGLVGGADPATNIENVYFGRFKMDRKGARAAFDGWNPPPSNVEATWGQPPEKLFKKRGEWQFTFLDTAGDPTTDPAGNRVWQIAFMGEDPDKSVTPLIPETTPLAGARHLATFGQFQSDGGVRDFAALSDFGSNKVGPDGQTRYYNAKPEILAFTTPDGLVIVTPAKVNQLGFRPMGYDEASNAWDFVAGPGGPMAFVAPDGVGPGIFSFVGLVLKHDAIPGQDFTFDGETQSGVTLLSQNALLLASALFVDPGQPVIDLTLDIDGHEAVYRLLPEFVSGFPWASVSRYGIPSYGRYCLIGAAPANDDWSEVTPVTDEVRQEFLIDVRRALGTSCWRVDKQEGLLNAAAYDASLAAGEPFYYDPVAAAALLEEGGWKPIE